MGRNPNVRLDPLSLTFAFSLVFVGHNAHVWGAAGTDREAGDLCSCKGAGDRKAEDVRIYRTPTTAKRDKTYKNPMNAYDDDGPRGCIAHFYCLCSSYA